MIIREYDAYVDHNKAHQQKQEAMYVLTYV